ncbi:hypothetical protein GCM10007170_19280 [Arthrobacter liuii]|uniref:Uncharacterized protein n=1 Tax=Arthrobacter liuii TaxID=1476996 RepID=A0ABQ2AS82_9MICC|nr:hypothetical protein GCM10007170_19280 [Arthrobacter liuii]
MLRESPMITMRFGARCSGLGDAAWTDMFCWCVFEAMAWPVAGTAGEGDGEGRRTKGGHGN